MKKLSLIALVCLFCACAGNSSRQLPDSPKTQSGQQPRDSAYSGSSADSAKAIRTNSGNADPSGRLKNKK